MEPLTRIVRRAPLLLGLVVLTINIAYAQAGGPSVTCAVTAVPRQVRAEGVTEPVGNIILQCSSVNPGATFTGNYTIFLPVDVTNRIDSNSLTTDAVFSADYGLGYVAVPGVSGRISGHSISFNGVTLTVPAGRSILKVLLDHKIDILYACEEGWCGNCKTRCLGGKVDHRDEYLSDAEREQYLQVCISRAAPGERKLVLDL